MRIPAHHRTLPAAMSDMSLRVRRRRILGFTLCICTASRGSADEPLKDILDNGWVVVRSGSPKLAQA